jgi:hypothetical protein
MSKRMTDTGIWDKSWFRKLPLEYKLFWQFIKDRCDFAGFWDVDFEAASFFIGRKIDKKTALEFFKDQIYPVNGKYWLITDFIKFQNGWPLNEKSPIHSKIIELLNSKGIEIKNNTLWDRVGGRVCNTPQVIVIERVIEEERVEDNRKGVQGENKKNQPPLNESDLTAELQQENQPVYTLAKMVLNNCPDIMLMEYPLSLQQLKELVKKYGYEDTEKTIKAMQNKGIKYLKQRNLRYAFLTIENWIKR